MTGIFATKAEAQAFALTVLGFMCRIGSHSACGWIDSRMDGAGLHPWPMPVGHGVQAWCSCDCHHAQRGVLL